MIQPPVDCPENCGLIPQIRGDNYAPRTSLSLAAIALCLALASSCAGQGITEISRQDSPQAPISQQDCEASGEFIYVPAGEFISGSDRAERDYAYQISAVAANPQDPAAAETSLRRKRWFEREGERDRLTLPAFCIARAPVTQADYQQFVQATGHRVPTISAADYERQGFLVHPYSSVQAFLWQGNQPPEDTAKHPVVLVSYNDALAFAAWKGEQDGHTYRLPSEQEWEKAARGTEGQYFPWGNDWQAEATNWGGSGLDSTSAVGQFPLSRSLYGLEDMAGNVFEYTETKQGQKQVMKGCSWDDLPGFCRAAYRHTRPPESRHILFGFRLVRSR